MRDVNNMDKKDDISLAIHYYFLLNSMDKTADSFLSEFSERKVLPHSVWHEKILYAFDSRNSS